MGFQLEKQKDEWKKVLIDYLQIISESNIANYERKPNQKEINETIIASFAFKVPNICIQLKNEKNESWLNGKLSNLNFSLIASPNDFSAKIAVKRLTWTNPNNLCYPHFLDSSPNLPAVEIEFSGKSKHSPNYKVKHSISKYYRENLYYSMQKWVRLLLIILHLL